MRIVCIHAHPDDAEILAGGTLALLAGFGHEVTIVTMTAGDGGSDQYGPAEISEIRTREALAAAKTIGAGYHCAGFQDLAIFNDDPSRRRVTQILRELRPDVLLTASPSDYLCDHEATSHLVRDAAFACAVPNYRTGTETAPLAQIPHLYFVDPIESVDRSGAVVKPDFVVNVGSVLETKKRMLAAHESQRAWLRRQHNIDDYLLSMVRWTRAAGARAGIEYGEGFRQYGIHPYPRSPLLQGALGSYVVAAAAL